MEHHPHQLRAATRRLMVAANHMAAREGEGHGVTGHEAASVGSALRAGWRHEASFDVGAMTRLLDHDNHDVRQRFRAFARHPLFALRHNVPLALERELALQRTPTLTLTPTTKKKQKQKQKQKKKKTDMGDK